MKIQLRKHTPILLIALIGQKAGHMFREEMYPRDADHSLLRLHSTYRHDLKVRLLEFVVCVTIALCSLLYETHLR